METLVIYFSQKERQKKRLDGSHSFPVQIWQRLRLINLTGCLIENGIYLIKGNFIKWAARTGYGDSWYFCIRQDTDRKPDLVWNISKCSIQFSGQGKSEWKKAAIFTTSGATEPQKIAVKIKRNILQNGADHLMRTMQQMKISQIG